MRWMGIAIVLASVYFAGCDERTPDRQRSSHREPAVYAMLDRIDAAQAMGHSFELVSSMLDRAERMEGAAEVAYGIAQRRLGLALANDRPSAEVETALRAELALTTDPERRLLAASAAYATYLRFRPHFESAVADLEAMERTPVIERWLEYAARVRARAEGRE